MELVLDLDELKPTKTQLRKIRKRKLEEEQKSNEAQEKAKVCRTTNDKTENSSGDPSEQKVESNDQSHDGQQETESVNSYDNDDSRDSSSVNDDINLPQVINTENFKILSGGPEMNLPKSINAGHTAGFDAFMTGYVFATAITQISGAQVNEELKISGGQLPIWHNKVYLTGKEVPLAVAKSNFASVSNFHKQKHKNLHERMKV